MTAPWADAIAAICRGVPRLAGALCRDLPELFDAADDETARQAAELCGRCPAREPCAAWASTLAHNEASGVLAGQRRVWVSHPSLIRKPTTIEGPTP
ncbi:WhiB family transcriptional regulator [Mycobacterium palustre]|uniref:WhiB family transcriptional regulator n=1 Tax=Mycobacterium palustre TaxID=153971 RepID=UPI00115493EC|nr:WhiB family transcriptional regulator [Mycobacterium palustre]MCV7101530.1 WhiB family transcriptional regulator [Mycobacterium palustre]